ncbi:hypothetical protein AA3271_1182 [Gluconobacter japonicus NBRC 3271]|nr:hypothetical protein AA3271_1182 [Gluconobacter japonicus NBRC 3271]
MTDDRKTLDPKIVKCFQNILCHRGVAHGTMRADPMIAEIQGNRPECLGGFPLKKPEIAGSSKQTMQENNGFRPIPTFDGIEFHA